MFTLARTPRTWSSGLATMALAILIAPHLAAAQISGVGGTVDVIPGYPVVRGTDTAYDPVNRLFFQVSAYGPVTGRFVDEGGTPVSGLITIAAGTAAFAHYPRAIYSPHVNGGAGGFLVVWHQNDGPPIGQAMTNQIHGRTVSYAANPVLGPDLVVGSSPGGTWWEAAPAGAYSVTSQQFLVAWQSFGAEIHAVRVNAAGAPVSAPFLVSEPGAGGRDPGVAWNANTDEFGVSCGGWDASSGMASLIRVRASDGAVLRRNAFYRGSGVFMTDITFNSAFGTFIVAYAGPNTRTTEINAAGDVVANGVTSTSVGTYDGLSVAYNPVSGTHLLVGHFTGEVGGVELDGHGAKIGAEQPVTAGGATTGSFYPRVSGASIVKLWQVSYSKNFAVAASQIIRTGTGGGGGPIDTDGDGVPDTVDQCPTVYAQTPNGCPVTSGPPNGDMNGDGQPDIVFEHAVSGMLYSWWLANGQLVGESLLTPPTVDPNWLIVSKEDFTGDGKVDLLWQHQSTGEIVVWQMQGMQAVNVIPIPVGAGQWRIASTPDLNRDGYPDLVWQHAVSGNLHVWFLQRTASNQIALIGDGPFVLATGQPVSPANNGWKLVASGDLDSDTRPDLLFQEQTSTTVVGWILGGADGRTLVNGGLVMAWDTGPWRARALNDFNNDGKVDLIWQNIAAASPLFAWYLNGAGGVGQANVIGPLVNLPPNWRVVGGK